jgi:hypothetical protein
MKIRTNYVSNSSSSSFVLYSSDNLSKVADDLYEFVIKNLLKCYEDTDLAEVREAIDNAVKHSDDRDTIELYVRNSLYYALMHYCWYLDGFDSRASFICWAHRCPIKITKQLLKLAKVDDYYDAACELAKQWVEDHPDARVLEFHSDGGNRAEAAVRWCLDMFSCVNNSIGFFADNS